MDINQFTGFDVNEQKPSNGKPSNRKPQEKPSETKQQSMPSRGRKIFVVILILVFLGIGAVSLNFYKKVFITKPTPSPEANNIVVVNSTPKSQEQYRNQKYRFAFFIPEGMNFLKTQGSDVTLDMLSQSDDITLSGYENVANPGTSVSVRINIDPINATGNKLSCNDDQDCRSKILSLSKIQKSQLSTEKIFFLGTSHDVSEFSVQSGENSVVKRITAFNREGHVWSLTFSFYNMNKDEIGTIWPQIGNFVNSIEAI